MLYFCSSSASSGIRAVYTGRFVFKIEEISETHTLDRFASYVDQADYASLGEEMTHEAAHHQVFRFSGLGKQLVGLRFLARIAFARGQLEPVRTYYRMRTLYFLHSYEVHESLADQQTRMAQFLAREGRRAALPPLPYLDRKWIRNTDKCISQRLRGQGLYPSLGVRLLCGVLGMLAQYEMGVIVAPRPLHQQDTSPAVFGHKEVVHKRGLGGLFNAIFQPVQDDHWLLRHVKRGLQIFNVEGFFARLRGQTATFDEVDWTLVKFNAELDTIRAIYADPVDTRWRQHVDQEYQGLANYIIKKWELILRFAYAHQTGSSLQPTELPDAINFGIYELLDHLYEEHPLQRTLLTPNALNILHHTSGFFFYHGN